MSFRTLVKAKALFMLLIYCFGLLHNQVSQAQALPVAPAATFVMNRAVGQVITRVAAARGFAANDPRTLATMTSVGSSLTAVNTVSTVAGVGLAVAGAPLWIGLAASLGVLAVGAAIIAGNASISIDSSKVSVQQPTPILPAYTSPSSTDVLTSQMLLRGLQIYQTPSCLSTDKYCSQFPVVPTNIVKPFAINEIAFIIVLRSLADLDWYDNTTANVAYPELGETVTYQHYWVPNADGTIQTLFRRATGMELVCNAVACNLNPFNRTFQRTDITVDPSVYPLIAQNLGKVCITNAKTQFTSP